MKILVTGATGQLGSELISVLKNKSSEIGPIDKKYYKCEIFAADSGTLDISSKQDISYVFEKTKPDIVINCAAFTDVDACETKPELAMKVNAIGPFYLAKNCSKIGARLVHISTDYIFSGDNSTPYCEWDIASPCGVYGKSKLLGEKYINAQTDKFFIIRTSWLYGYNGKNFVKTILNLAKEKKQIKVVRDQIGTPTNANDLAHHILKIACTENYGIYHCSGNGHQTSWFDFASLIVKYAGLNCRVEPCSTQEFSRAARRPKYSVLDNLMLRCTVGDEMRLWQDALFAYINKLKLEGKI